VSIAPKTLEIFYNADPTKIIKTAAKSTLEVEKWDAVIEIKLCKSIQTQVGHEKINLQLKSDSSI